MSIDPKIVGCSCGYHFHPTLWMKIIMLVRGEYVKRCPRCQCRMKLVLYNFVVCKEREKLDKRELWEHG